MIENSALPDPLSGTAQMESLRYRKKIQYTKRIGHSLSLIIASIDGVVTAMAVTSVPFLAVSGLPLVILVGVCGFLINRVVYWRSVPDMLRQLFVDHFLKGLSLVKKILILSSSVFAATLGLGFSALAFKSMCALAGFSMTTIFTLNPALAIVITFFALGYFIANTSLFFFSLSKTIRHNAHKKIQRFFKKCFTRDKKVPLIRHSIIAFFRISFTLAGFALGVIAAYAILGKLASSLTEVLVTTSAVAKEVATLITKIIVFGFASVARFTFSIEAAAGIFAKMGETLGATLYGLGWAARHPAKASTMISTAWRAWRGAQQQSMRGKPFKQSYQEWFANPVHLARLEKGDFSQKLACYRQASWAAFSHQPAVRKLVWGAEALWFMLHIPAILVNALGVLALGAGGGPHLHTLSNQLGIPTTPEDAATGAMLSAGLFSASLGLHKYLDLAIKENDGTSKRINRRHTLLRHTHFSSALSEEAPTQPSPKPRLNETKEQQQPLFFKENAPFVRNFPRDKLTTLFYATSSPSPTKQPLLDTETTHSTETVYPPRKIS